MATMPQQTQNPQQAQTQHHRQRSHPPSPVQTQHSGSSYGSLSAPAASTPAAAVAGTTLSNPAQPQPQPSTPRSRIRRSESGGGGNEVGASCGGTGSRVGGIKLGLKRIVNIKGRSIRGGVGSNAGVGGGRRHGRNGNRSVAAENSAARGGEEHAPCPSCQVAAFMGGTDAVAGGPGAAVGALVRSIASRSPTSSSLVLSTRPGTSRNASVRSAVEEGGDPLTASGREEENDDILVVRSMESFLRKALFLSMAYSLGAATGGIYLPLVSKAAELLAVSWATCAVVLLLIWTKQRGRSATTSQAIALDTAGMTVSKGR